MCQVLCLQRTELRAFVVDDTAKVRRGKKMEDVSRHYVHNSGRCVMWQQVVQLEWVSTPPFFQR